MNILLKIKKIDSGYACHIYVDNQFKGYYGYAYPEGGGPLLIGPTKALAQALVFQNVEYWKIELKGGFTPYNPENVQVQFPYRKKINYNEL